MKINEFRLIDIIVKENDKIIYKGPAEQAPDEIKCLECKEIKLANGKADILI